MSDLDAIPPVINLVKTTPDTERRYTNKALRALADYIASVAASSGQVDEVQAGNGITVDNTDPTKPIVAAEISADVGNNISFGLDGGLFATGGGGGTTDIHAVRKIVALRAF